MQGVDSRKMTHSKVIARDAWMFYGRRIVNVKVIEKDSRIMPTMALLRVGWSSLAFVWPPLSRRVPLKGERSEQVAPLTDGLASIHCQPVCSSAIHE